MTSGDLTGGVDGENRRGSGPDRGVDGENNTRDGVDLLPRGATEDDNAAGVDGVEGVLSDFGNEAPNRCFGFATKPFF